MSLQDTSYLPDAAARAKMAALWPRLTDCLQAIHERIPDALLPYFEPHKVLPPANYNSPKDVAAFIHSMSTDVLTLWSNGKALVPTQISCLGVIYRVVAEAVPIYYVSEDLIRAVAATELPPDMRFSDLKWPRTAMVLGLPPKFMKGYTGWDMSYVLAARIASGENPCPFRTVAPTLTSYDAKCAWAWPTWVDGHLESYASSYWEADRLASMSDYQYVDYTGVSEEQAKVSENSVNRVSLLIAKLLAVLTMREALVRPGKCVRPAATRKGNTKPALWSPNMIGEGYRLLTAAGSSREGRSVSVHFRSGHWTYQVIGAREDLLPVTAMPRTAEGQIDWPNVSEELRTKFFRCHVRKWIQPTLVGGNC